MMPTKKFRRWWWRGWYIDSEPMIVVRLRTMMIVVAMIKRWNDWNSDWCLDILCIHTYQNCILVCSIKWREFSYAHLKASGTDVLQPYIHCVTGFCSSSVFRRDKHNICKSSLLLPWRQNHKTIFWRWRRNQIAVKLVKRVNEWIKKNMN